MCCEKNNAIAVESLRSFVPKDRLLCLTIEYTSVSDSGLECFRQWFGVFQVFQTVVWGVSSVSDSVWSVSDTGLECFRQWFGVFQTGFECFRLVWSVKSHFAQLWPLHVSFSLNTANRF